MKRTPDGTVSLFAGGKYGYADGQQDKAEFSVITDMAFGRDGAIYLTDTDRVRRIDKSGTVTTIYRGAGSPNNQQNPESYSRLFGLTVDGQNNVFVADYGNRRVLKITSGGAVSTEARAEQPWSPTGVALKDHNLYILEFGFTPPSTFAPRVRKLSSDGSIKVVATIGDTRIASSSPSVDESPSVGSSERSARSKPSVPYVLLGVGVVIFALSIVTWRVRRRKSSHQH